MALERLGRPYGQFKFQVLIGSDSGTGPNAGFQEVSGLGLEIHVAEYQVGNSLEKGPVKVTGSCKIPDITLKRGVIGVAVAQTWTLTNARPIKYTGPSLTGKGTDVAIEELVLASEHIEVS